MTTLTRPISDLDLGIDIGVRTGLDLLTRQLAEQRFKAGLAAGLGDGPDAAAHEYTIAVLGELAGELAGRFR
jgi:hypothetical protein